MNVRLRQLLRIPLLIPLLMSAIILCACTGSSSAPAPASTGGSQTAGSPADVPLGIGCGWQLVSDSDLTNVLYPDESAVYWLAAIPNLPALRLRIDGLYPDARYFSFNVYDPLLRPTDAIADLNIAPLTAGTNPYVQAGTAAGAAYRAYVEFTQKPAAPAANTIYSGFINAGQATLPNPLVTVLAYRVYVPADGLRGNVRLPQLTLETADGSRALGTLPNCNGPLLPNLGGTLPDLGINPLLANTSYPEVLSALPYPFAAYPPVTNVFYGLPDSYIGIVNNLLPAPLPIQPGSLPLTGGGGFLSNKDNAYTTTAFSRSHGSLFVLRARAPSFRTEPGVAFGSEDTRYWSVCQNEFVTKRYVACARDDQIPLDRDGFFTVVVSDATVRPANAVAANGITWLPWGAYPDGLLIYRQLLAAPSFAPAIRNVPEGTAPAQIMGDYLPRGVYCAPTTFAAAGTQAADIFAACAAAASP
ncbi:MAG: hypothetical protein ACRETW_01325 [Stenotrophobium sp.]